MLNYLCMQVEPRKSLFTGFDLLQRLTVGVRSYQYRQSDHYFYNKNLIFELKNLIHLIKREKYKNP